MGIIMAILISAAMGAIASYLVRNTGPSAATASQAPALISYGTNIGLSIILGLIIALILPLGKLGRGLAKKANADPPGFKFTVLNALPISIINTILISLALSAFGVFQARANIPEGQKPPFLAMWIPSWARLLIPTLIASYVIACILSPIVSSMLGLGKDAEYIRAKLKVHAGDRISRAEVEDAVNTIYGQGAYEYVTFDLLGEEEPFHLKINIV